MHNEILIIFIINMINGLNTTVYSNYSKNDYFANSLKGGENESIFTWT